MENNSLENIKLEANAKFNFIHCTFQEILNGNIDVGMIEDSLIMIEDFRELTEPKEKAELEHILLSLIKGVE
jgi:hypothetical protein